MSIEQPEHQSAQAFSFKSLLHKQQGANINPELGKLSQSMENSKIHGYGTSSNGCLGNRFCMPVSNDIMTPTD